MASCRCEQAKQALANAMRDNGLDWTKGAIARAINDEVPGQGQITSRGIGFGSVKLVKSSVGKAFNRKEELQDLN